MCVFFFFWLWWDLCNKILYPFKLSSLANTNTRWQRWIHNPFPLLLLLIFFSNCKLFCLIRTSLCNSYKNLYRYSTKLWGNSNRVHYFWTNSKYVECKSLLPVIVTLHGASEPNRNYYITFLLSPQSNPMLTPTPVVPFSYITFFILPTHNLIILNTWWESLTEWKCVLSFITNQIYWFWIMSESISVLVLISCSSVSSSRTWRCWVWWTARWIHRRRCRQVQIFRHACCIGTTIGDWSCFQRQLV